MDTAEAEGRLRHDVGWEFMIAEKKGLVWCHVFKSASSRSVDIQKTSLFTVTFQIFEHTFRENYANSFLDLSIFFHASVETVDVVILRPVWFTLFPPRRCLWPAAGDGLAAGSRGRRITQNLNLLISVGCACSTGSPATPRITCETRSTRRSAWRASTSLAP